MFFFYTLSNCKEAEWSWRDEDRGVVLFLLLGPEVRGPKLETLNRNGLVLVDIRENLVRVTITDTWSHLTHNFQWLNLWAPIVPGESNYHLSEDNKRIVLRLQKVHDTHSAGSWASLLDVRTGRYSKVSTGWPGILREVQGAWRSADEEPIEVVGHQVVWPEGSRDVLAVDEERETFRLVQAGDGNKVPAMEFHGFYERQSHRLRWDDGDFWSRIPGLALQRQDAGCEALPLQYDKQLLRWVPWLPPEGLRRGEAARWLPQPGSEVRLLLEIKDDNNKNNDNNNSNNNDNNDDNNRNNKKNKVGELEEAAGRQREDSLRSTKRELLRSLQAEDAETSADDNNNNEEPGRQVGVVLAGYDFLPLSLILQCRVCALSHEEASIGLVEALLALRAQRPVSPGNEAAALGGLSRWLQWLRCWLAPGARRNVDGALQALKERLFQLSKERRSHAHREKSAAPVECWPPSWTCSLADASDLLTASSQRLSLELRLLVAQEQLGLGPPDPQQLFGAARRRVAETLLDFLEVPSVSGRRCDVLERRWARRYAQEAARNLLANASPTLQAHQRELSEGGLTIVEDALDWGSLVKIHGEVPSLLCSQDSAKTGVRVRCCGAGGRTTWAEVWESQLEEVGLLGLAAAVALLHQVPVHLSSSAWAARPKKAVPSAAATGFGGCRWSAASEVVLWRDKGSNSGDVERRNNIQAALEWVADRGQGDYDSDLSGDASAVPPGRRLLAFLFLNTPAWSPAWGGPLKCHLGSISRDVWGDGGRLVLLHEVCSYELLPSTRQQTVLLLRLLGTSVCRSAAAKSTGRAATGQQCNVTTTATKATTATTKTATATTGQQNNSTVTTAETATARAAETAAGEKTAATTRIETTIGPAATQAAGVPAARTETVATAATAAATETLLMATETTTRTATPATGAAVVETAPHEATENSTPTTLANNILAATALAAETAAEPSQETAATATATTATPTLAATAAAAETAAEPITLKLDSHEVIRLFEESLPSAFLLD
ncbi:unnamed protein product [Polarella glacialis]|uniref:CS domain-containing protein n=1 Tax=Polarella glacialis TaxID=89957 RepID=A0A813FYG7_POLGL|nr:unnamed protein product [Polarella glacialis]